MATPKIIYKLPGCTENPSFFSNIGSTDPTLISWETIQHLISIDHGVAQNTTVARKLLESDNRAGYNKAKAKSGAITPAAQCQGGHKVSDITTLTGVSMVDLDHVPPEALEEAVAKIRADPHTMMCYITCSGLGVRVFFKYSSDTGEAAYFDAWSWGNQYYSMQTGLEHDRATKDPSRLSYLSHDPDCYYNPDSEPFNVTPVETQPADFKTTTDADRIRKAEEILARQGENFSDGNRHNYLLKIARLFYKYGIPQEEATDYAVGLMDNEPQEATKVVAWVYCRTDVKFGAWLENISRPQLSKLKKSEAEETEVSGASSGRNYATPEEVKQYLLNNEQLRYNTVSSLVELWNPKTKAFEDINDRLSNSIWQQAILDLGKYVKPLDYERVLNSDCIPAFNPFEEYFEGLPEWDGEDHIAALAARVHTKTPSPTPSPLMEGAEDTTGCATPPPYREGAGEEGLFEYCFRKWLVATVASWLDARVMNQVILTFIGGQGLFKSTFFRKLMPPQLERYFLAKGNSTYVSKDDKLAVTNYGLIDFEEIDSMKDADLNAVKALVTTEVIAERAAYAKNRENRPHLASFCGTGNNLRFLTDLTGNRRWLPFEIESIDSPYDHPIDYDQLYAQALHLVRSGFQYWFSRDEDLALERHKSRFAEPCPEEELFRRYYREAKEGEVGCFFTATEVAARCNVDLRGFITPKRMGQVLAKLGLPAKHIRGKHGYVLVERTYEEIQMGRVDEVTELMRAEKAAKENRQLKMFDNQT